MLLLSIRVFEQSACDSPLIREEPKPALNNGGVGGNLCLKTE